MGEDLFVSGYHQISRISPTGKVMWRYDDLATSQDVYNFRFARDLMLHAVSPDGKHLLVAAFGVEPYARFVSRFVRPAVLLFAYIKTLFVLAKRAVDVEEYDLTQPGLPERKASAPAEGASA